MKDAFITTVTNRIKVKQIGRRVLGEESGPLHLALTPTANNMGVELPGLIGLHPVNRGDSVRPWMTAALVVNANH